MEEITYQSIPTRDVRMLGTARKPRSKLTSAEFKAKEINIKGRVFGTSASDLRNKLDTLHQNFAGQSIILAIDTDRSYTVTLEKLDIPNRFYNSSMVQYDAMFLAVDPFAYANQLTASGTTVSGTVTLSGSLTVSGTVFAEPTLTIYPTGASNGNSGINAIRFTYVPTGETLTVSGTFNYSAPIVIDFHNFLVTNNGSASDFTGIFSRFEPGVRNYTLAVTTGVKQGFNFVWAYSPRYYT